MEELAILRRDIRGETKGIPPASQKKRLIGKKGKDKDYPPLPNQGTREERRNNPIREVRWSTIVAKGNPNRVEIGKQPAKTGGTNRAMQKQAAAAKKGTTPNVVKRRRAPRTAAVVLNLSARAI